MLSSVHDLLSLDIDSSSNKDDPARASMEAQAKQHVTQPLDEMLIAIQTDENAGFWIAQAVESDRIVTVVRAAEGDTAFYVLVRRQNPYRRASGPGHEMTLPSLSIHRTDALNIVYRDSEKPNIVFRFTSDESHRPLPLLSDNTNSPMDLFLQRFYLSEIRRVRSEAARSRPKKTG